MHSSNDIVILFLYLSSVLCFASGKNYDVCSSTENENLCQVEEIQSTIVCAGGLQEEYKGKNSFVVTVSLCHWPDDVFNPQDILSRFPNIEKFILSKSGIKKLSKDFPESITLKELNVSYTAIEYFDSTVFSKLTSLNVLDLRYNKLRMVDPVIITNLNNLEQVYLAGNHYYCSDTFLWVTSKNNTLSKLIKDVDCMMCGGSRYNGKPLKRVILIIETLKSECHKEVPINCTCILDHVIRVGNNFRPMITVNCSYQNLRMLPPGLPSFTSTLIMRGNMISNLSEFVTNESYFKLLNVYLDNNSLSSINMLAVSSWLLTFRALSLRGNNLSEIPIYALEDAFEKNHNIGKFLLSENPWKCDCMFAPPFKDFLVKYRSIIKDVSSVKCADKDNDQNSLFPILFISRKEMCKENTTYSISLLNFLSICFAIMLILLLGDFVRNYYLYKKYSQLPWIANKLP